MNRLLSSCCGARANVNVRDGGYVCSACAQDCAVTEQRAGLQIRSTLSTVRKPTGERELFTQLWAKCKGKSEVSDKPLLPPEHPQFHFQGSHILNKNTYPDYRLDPRNIVMVTVDEHSYWTNEPGRCMIDTRWDHVWKRFHALKAEAHRKGKVVIDEAHGHLITDPN